MYRGEMNGKAGSGFVRTAFAKTVNMATKGPTIIVDKTKEKTTEVVDTTRKMVYNAIATLCTFVLIISLSVFLYGTFYYAYMPLEMHEAAVNLQFSPCEDSMGPCSYPNASIPLGRNSQLMVGQPYSISLQMEVPDSVVNQGLGMFMSCLKIQKDGKDLKKSCKSAILEFRSDLLRVIETVAFAPLLLCGVSTQRQWLTINYYSKFLDDPHAPATNMVVEVQSKFIQLYNTKLLIHAEFSGLRHIMYHHPWISSTAGILSNVLILTMIILISWTRFFTPEDLIELDNLDSGLHGDITEREDSEEKEDDIEIVKTH